MPGLRRSRAAGALAALAAAVLTFALSAGPAWAAESARAAGPTIGPVQINPVGHPRLCWQAGGNGSGVTLERCDPALQGQQSPLTSDGVVMNGNGYCLEAGPATALYIDFASQCAGSGPGPGHKQGGRGQVWQYRAGQLASAGTGACAGPGGPVVAGAPILRRPCPAGSRWSIGYSAVTVAPGPGGGQSGPDGGTFAASVTVTDAASAQEAYGVAITFSLPPHLSASGLHVTGAAGWTCDVRRVTCTGTLPSGASGKVEVTGRLGAATPGSSNIGSSYTVRARAAVTGTSQRPGAHSITSASLAVPVRPAPPRPASPIRLALILIAVAALLLAGALLIYITRRRPRHAARSRPRSRSHRMPQ